MKLLEKVYWIRLALGILAALLCTAYVIGTNSIPRNIADKPYIEDYTTLWNSISIALIVYLISYYMIKMKYGARIEKPSKILTTGIGIYLLTWIVVFTLLYTILAGPQILS